MGRLADGTKIRATKRMADESAVPKKASSIENRKSTHKLADIQVPVHRSGSGNEGVTAKMFDNIPGLVGQRKRR